MNFGAKQEQPFRSRKVESVSTFLGDILFHKNQSSELRIWKETTGITFLAITLPTIISLKQHSMLPSNQSCNLTKISWYLQDCSDLCETNIKYRRCLHDKTPASQIDHQLRSCDYPDLSCR